MPEAAGVATAFRPIPRHYMLIREGVVLGFDFGTQRIGVAIGNTITRSARALTILPSVPIASRWPQIAALIAEWQPIALVVGAPLYPDGAPHEMSARCERFARQLEGRYALPVARVDERYSSVAAAQQGARPGALDAEAAAIVLQNFLEDIDA